MRNALTDRWPVVSLNRSDGSNSLPLQGFAADRVTEVLACSTAKMAGTLVTPAA